MKVDIKLEEVDDELLYKRILIKLGNKKVLTPTKTNPSLLVNSINEVYSKFTPETIEKCLNDNEFERRKNYEIKRRLKRNLNFYIISYAGRESPTKKQIEFLADLQYGHSDVVITPTWSQIVRSSKDIEKLLDTYRRITNDFIDTIETLNYKTIVGMISAKLPRIILEPIIVNYINRDITSFVIDFDGRSIDSGMSWTRNLMRIIKREIGFEHSFLYSLNANRGRFAKNAIQILAKDFMNTAFGMDIVGLNHIPIRMTTEAWARFRSTRKEFLPRIFLRESYGYKKVRKEELRKHGILDAKEFSRNEQYDEKRTLQTKLKEESSVIDYIQSKSQVDEKIIKKIKKIKSETI